MKPLAPMPDTIRDTILTQPDIVLEDREIMRVLVGAGTSDALGENIVDLRGIAMDRLEARLDRLEDTHRNVIAAAYENLAGTNQIHRAILRLLEPTEFDAFLIDLGGDVADILRVDSVKLVLETEEEPDHRALRRIGGVLSVAEPGFIDDYLTRGRKVPVRLITLRAVEPGQGGLYAEGGDWIRSEACMKLDLGPKRRPGMLAFGSEDPQQFTPAHGTDLIGFFAGVFERAMRRWLA